MKNIKITISEDTVFVFYDFQRISKSINLFFFIMKMKLVFFWKKLFKRMNAFLLVFSNNLKRWMPKFDLNSIKKTNETLKVRIEFSPFFLRWNFPDVIEFLKKNFLSLSLFCSLRWRLTGNKIKSNVSGQKKSLSCHQNFFFLFRKTVLFQRSWSS